MAHLLRFQRNVSSLRGLLKATPQNIRAISTTPKKQETIAADTAPKVIFFAYTNVLIFFNPYFTQCLKFLDR